MTVKYETAVCPLCHQEFDEPESFRSHLADEHGLVDDEGTETVLPEAPPPLPVLDTPPGRAALEPTTVPPLPSAPAAPSFIPPPPAAPAAVTAPRRSGPPAALAIVLSVQLLLGLLGLAIVDGDDAREDRSAVTVGDSPASPASPPPAAPDPAADQRRVDAMAPRVSDLPPGWVAEDPNSDDDSGSDEFDRRFEACAANVEDPFDTSTAQKEVAFSHGDDALFGQVGTTRTAEDAIKGMDAISAVLPCFGDAFQGAVRSELPRNMTVTVGKFEPINGGNHGDQTVARSMLVTMSGPGGQVGMQFDFLAIRKDRALAMMFALNVNDGLTVAQERALLGSVASRM